MNAVEFLSRRINGLLSQPLRNEVLRITHDNQDLSKELLKHNGQGELDLVEMKDKAHGIVACGMELLSVIDQYERERKR